MSIAVPELDPQVELLTSLFGFRPDWEQAITQHDFRYMAMDIPGCEVGWEVMEPVGDDSYISRFLATPAGPGLHHATMRVPDVEAALADLEAMGIEPFGIPLDRQTWPWRETYIHPRRGSNGFLLQLYSTPNGRSWHRHNAARWEGAADDGSLGITGFSYVAHVHSERVELAAWYERVFGMRRTNVALDPIAGAAAVDLRTPTGQLRWQLIEPATANSPLHAFVDDVGSGMHHVAFEVGDWDRAVAACDRRGIAIAQQRAGESHGVEWRDGMLHTEDVGFRARLIWRAASAGG